MDARYEEVKRLFHAVCDMAAAERARHLDAHCADPELRRQVEALLQADHREVRDSLDRAVSRTCSDDADLPVSIPERIGDYRIHGICGVGGMGTVYEAERDEPPQRVAIKVIQRARATGEILRRFRREVEVLSRLSHPGIAATYEAGAFEQDGVRRPFLAMEFVHGPNLTEHCITERLAVADRIDLFARVCDAVEYSHQQGVVHRDLKPDNILVVPAADGTAACQPKVLDFGVARLTGEDTMTLATRDGQLIGSLSYMSPEQASGRAGAVDARSDVYSLGVVLFELLAGRLPYDVTGRPLPAAVSIICNHDGPRLSVVAPASSRDLEVIVGKCLEKEPRQRYQSAGALARDLRRHRDGQPIAARPPGTFHLFTKFARRHRALVGGTVAALLALIVGLVVAVVFAIRATDNEQRALREARRSGLAAANAWLATDPIAARRALDLIPPAQRGWEWRHLDSGLRCHRLDLGASLAATPLVGVDGGALLLAAVDARRMRLFDTTTGAIVAEWQAPGEATAWAVADDGSRLAAALEDGRVFVGARGDRIAWDVWYRAAAAPHQLAFAPNGAELAVVCGSSLAVGNPTVGFRRCELASSDGRHCVAFSPDGEHIAAIATKGGGVSLLATRDLSTLRHRHDEDDARSLAWRGTEIVLGTLQRTVDVCAVETLLPTKTLAGHTRTVTSVAAGADGALVTASHDGTVRVWGSDGGCRRVFMHPGVRRAAFLSADRVVSASPDSIRIWQLDHSASRVLTGHHSYVYEVAFSADGSLVASHVPFEPYELTTWEAWSGDQILRRPGPWKSAALTFDDQGNCITGQGTAVEVTPWYLPGGEERHGAPGVCLVVGRDLTLQTANTVAGLDAAALEVPHAYRTEYSLGADAAPPRLFLDGSPLALTAKGNEPLTVGPRPRLFVGNAGVGYGRFEGAISDLIVFGDHLGAEDAASVDAYLARRRHGEEATLGALRAPLLAHFRADSRSVSRIAESDHVDGWAASNDAGLRLLPLGHGSRQVRYRAATPDRAARVEFASGPQLDGWLEVELPAARGRERLTVCLLGSWGDRNMRWRRAAFGIETPRLIGPGSHQPDVRRRRIGSTVALSADGRRRACTEAYHGGAVRVRDTTTGAVLRRFGDDADGRTFWGVDLRPDGRVVAAGTTDGLLMVWDVDSGRQLATVPAHDGTVYAVAFSPDGHRLVTGGNDNSIRVWDAEHYELLVELRGHELYVKALAWSPDGTMLASASGDHTVRLWDSVPAIERQRQLNAAHELEGTVRPAVLGWIDELGDAASVGARIREVFAGDEASRQAAFKVLARTR